MKPEYRGPNYCPGCGCNIRAIALAMMFVNKTDQPHPQINGSRKLVVTLPQRTATIKKGEIISKDVSEQILRMAKEGMKPKAIANHFGVTAAKISGHLQYKLKTLANS